VDAEVSLLYDFGATIMDEMLVLRISGNDCVNLNGVALRSTREVAEALEKMSSTNPGLTVSIEASDSIYYEAIGKAIYASHRAGFSGERLRILVDGKTWES
jgi:biopolymer transport protein ExbD